MSSKLSALADELTTFIVTDRLYVAREGDDTPYFARPDTIAKYGTLTANRPFTVAQTWNNSGVTFTGLSMDVTDTASNANSVLVDLKVGGASRFAVFKNGVFGNNNPANGGIRANGSSVEAVLMNASAYTQFRARSFNVVGSAGSFTNILEAEASNALQLRNGANAQTFDIFNNYTDGSNNEKLTIGAESNVFIIRSSAAGTGTPRNMQIGPNGTGTALVLRSAGANRWVLDSSGHIIANADNFYDIGGPSTRARTGYFGTSVLVGTTSSGIQVGGNANQLITFYNSANISAQLVGDNSGSGGNFEARFGSGGTINWNSAASLSIGSIDLILARDAANTLAQCNGTNAQASRIYNTYTDASNYERAGLYWSGNFFYIEAQKAGTGSSRSVVINSLASAGTYFQVNGTNIAQISSTGLIFTTNNQYDIGDSAGNKPRNIYAGSAIYAVGSINSDAGLRMAGLSGAQILGSSSNIISFLDQAGTGFGRLNFGPATSSSPALKRSSAILQARLADDSDFTALQAKLRTHANANAETPTATHTLSIFDAAGTEYKVLAVAA